MGSACAMRIAVWNTDLKSMQYLLSASEVNLLVCIDQADFIRSLNTPPRIEVSEADAEVFLVAGPDLEGYTRHARCARRLRAGGIGCLGDHEQGSEVGLIALCWHRTSR